MIWLLWVISALCMYLLVCGYIADNVYLVDKLIRRVERGGKQNAA